MTNTEINTGRSVAYRRCSTNEDKQDVSRQLFGMSFDKEFEEYASGSSIEKRPVFQECLAYVEKGDTLSFADMSRAARNASELLVTVDTLVKEGITVVFVAEGLTFTDNPEDAMKAAMSKMLLTMLSAVNELYLAQGSAAVKSGMKKARAAGTKFGAANESYKRSDKSISRRNNIAAQTRCKPIAETLRLLVSIGTRNTFKSLAESLTKAQIATSSGLETGGVSGRSWSASQVQRVCKLSGICIHSN